MIESEIFKVSQLRFALLLLERHGLGWVMGGIILFATSLFLGVFLDYRIIVADILIMCLILPGALMILYYNYGLRGSSFVNILPHRLIIGGGKLIVLLKIYGNVDKEEGGEEKDGSKNHESGDEWKRYEFSIQSFGKYSVGKDYVVFPFLPPDSGFVYLPVEAFRDEKEFLDAVALISKNRS